MKRYRFELPTPRSYVTQDLLHDALVGAMVEVGARPDQVVGEKALPWNFAPLTAGGRYDADRGVSTRRLGGLVVSSADNTVSGWLEQIQGEHILAARTLGAEMINLSGATKHEETAPFVAGQETTAVHWLSPFLRRKVIPRPEGAPEKQDWLVDPKEIEKKSPGAQLAASLGLEGDLGLVWMADRLALRGMPARQGVDIKTHPKTGRAVWVNGTTVPFVLSGPTQSLVLAWYAGLGAKTRMGFGCWDTQPHMPAERKGRGQQS